MSNLPNPSARRNPLAVALYVNAALLLAIVAVLIARDPAPTFVAPAMGQLQPTVGGGAGLYLMPGQFSTNVWGCYIMDVDQQTLCAYTVTGSPPQLRLVAARNFRYDRRLGNFNTPNPSPLEVKELVEKEQEQNRARNPNE